VDGTAARPPVQAVASPCLLCGRRAAFIGNFRPNDRPRQRRAYGLRRRHMVNQTTNRGQRRITLCR
jgi:hypothetical protein